MANLAVPAPRPRVGRPQGRDRVRYYLGVDWADQTHAVWVVEANGTKIAAHTVPHTAEGLSEWGRERDQWRAQGVELWAAIERREGRVVDFLLDHGVAVYPVNPKRGIGFAKAGRRMIRLTRGFWRTFCAPITRISRPCSRARTPPRSSNSSRTIASGRSGSRHVSSIS
jgi:Transposase